MSFKKDLETGAVLAVIIYECQKFRWLQKPADEASSTLIETVIHGSEESAKSIVVLRQYRYFVMELMQPGPLLVHSLTPLTSE